MALQYKTESPDYYITLVSRMPVLTDETTIELTIENILQEKEINDRKTDMLTKVRKELNNYDLQLKTVINVNPEKAKPFTPQEKFKKMAEKNPALKTLKDKLNLELDF